MYKCLRVIVIERNVDSGAIRRRLKSDACDWTKCYKWNMGTVRISGPRSRRARRACQWIDNEGEWASWGGLIHRRHRRNIHLHNSFLSVRFPQAGILNRQCRTPESVFANAICSICFSCMSEPTQHYEYISIYLVQVVKWRPWPYLLLNF